MTKLQELLPLSSDKECSKVFIDLAQFCRSASAELSARQRRLPLTLESLLGLSKDVVEQIPNYCVACDKRHERQQICDQCGSAFLWCCAGYPRETCVDPIYPLSGVRVSLQLYCKDCLQRKSISAESVVAQEEVYLRLLHYFSSDVCKWRWIPGFCDGFSVFSVTWVALEGMLFLESPFYCHIGTERDNIESRKDKNFVEFVKKCADTALYLLANEATEGNKGDVDTWTAVQTKPELASNLGLLDFHAAWVSVSRTLNLETPTRIFVWKFVNDYESLACDMMYGYDSEEDEEYEQVRNINILMWNTEVATHFDLLIPKVTDFDQKQAEVNGFPN